MPLLRLALKPGIDKQNTEYGAEGDCVMKFHDLEHPLYALVAQAIVGFLTGEWFWGGVIPAAFFIGREHAQAEYRWIEYFANGKRANMPWWATLDKRVWDVHSLWWNLLCPIVCVASVYIAMTYF